MSERSAFVLSLDKKLHSDLLPVALCPTQDLIACWSRDPLFSLSCYRLNWQKVWTHSPTEVQSEPTALCWHPDAGLLASGFADGYLLIVDTERGEVRSKVKTGKDAITSLSWLEEEERPQSSAKLFKNIQIVPKDGYGQSTSGTFAALCISNAAGEVALYTNGLSLLCRCLVVQQSIQQQRPHSKFQILRAAASRCLRFIYVLWSFQQSGQSQGQFISVLETPLLHEARIAVHSIATILEQQCILFKGIRSYLEVVKHRWKELNEIVQSIRNLMIDSLQELGYPTCPGEDMEQLQRLLLLGESACAPQIVSHFLVNKLGEAGLKQRAKALDSCLSVIVHDILEVAVQRNLEEVLALSDSLTSILLCKGEVHDLGLKEALSHEVGERVSQMLCQSVMIAKWATNFQAGFRTFFAWLLQRLQALDSADTTKIPQPANTDLILYILDQMQSEDLSGSLFDHQGRIDDPEDLLILGRSGGVQSSFKENFLCTVDLFRQSLGDMAKTLSGNVRVAQQIQLPSTSRPEAVAMYLPQGKNDSGEAAVFCCPLQSKISNDVLVVGLTPPESSCSKSEDTPHQVRYSRIRCEPGQQLVDTALVQQDDLALALLLQEKRQKGGSIRLFPLSAASDHQLAEPNTQQQQVVPEDGPADGELGSEPRTDIKEQGITPPLAISGGRGVAAHLIGLRRICIYVQDD